ncbi:MAG: minichromosome maintenance protein MCM [Candidatus Poseidoniaceae archaeon]|nr:minichromosome maintenance protein MCM [Candidatus Poseidoniaceae archaeon]
MLQEFDLAARWTSMIQDLYAEAVHNLAQKWPDEQSLEVSYRLIEGFDDDFAQNIIAKPDLHFQAANQALRQFLQDEGHTSMYPFVRIVHLPSDQVRTVSQLRADDISMMLSIDAIATKISGVRPRIYSASFLCGSCGHVTDVKQPNEQELVEPIECSQIDGGCGRPKRQTRFILQEDESILINSQFIELQESPEQLKGGIQPERIICIGEHDIAGKLNPGDRVKANGVLFIRSQRKGGKDTPVFDIFLRIHSLERQNVPLEEISITEDEELEIKELASRSDIYDLFSQSIAPSIFGMSRVKESLMLQLFGGVARLNPDGTRNRGDIHILLMGDPGVAKSQLLDYMSKISPRGQFTSGQSASAAGLTAAAVQDSAADGRWTLEAGALVLADLGLAAIDEFDKMNETDRSSMHEAMEQQTISISKAGINASLRTRCAVLAAANPKSGKFEPVSDIPFTAQINLAPPLVSRFDIIWLLTDIAEQEKDAKIARHIINNRLLGTSELLVNQGSAPDPSKKSSAGMKKSQEGDEILSKDLIRKYIAYSKRSIHPKLEEEARNRIVAFYVETRKKGGESSDSVSITARSLEAVARMAEASARIRLADIATVEDVERAIRLTRTWRNELMGENFDETALHTGKKAGARNSERILLDIIGDLQAASTDNIKVASLIDIFNEAQSHNIDRTKVEDMIEKMIREGRLMRPRGYESIQKL